MHRRLFPLFISSSIAVLLGVLGSCAARRPPAPAQTATRPPATRLATTPDGARPERILFLPDGRRLLTAGFVPARPTTINAPPPTSKPTFPIRLALWDFETGDREAEFGQSLSGSSVDLALVPHRREFLVLSGDGLSLWDLDRRERVKDLDPAHEGCNRVAVSGDGRYAAITAESSRAVPGKPVGPPLIVIDLATGKRMQLDMFERERPGLPSLSRFLGPANHMYSSATFSPDGSLLAAAVVDPTFHVRVFRLPQGQEVTRLIGHTRRIRQMSFSADGSRLFTASDDATVRTWDIAAGKELGCWDQPRGPVAGMVMTADRGTIAVTGGPVGGPMIYPEEHSSIIELLRSGDGARLAALVTPGAGWCDVAISPDGERIAASPAVGPGAAREVHLWRRADLATTQPMADDGEGVVVLRGHVHGVRDAVFAPDGNRVFTGGRDLTLRTWDAESGKLLDTYAVPEERRSWVITRSVRTALSDDGRWALFGRHAAPEPNPAITRSPVELVLRDLVAGKDVAAMSAKNARWPLNHVAVLAGGNDAVLADSGGAIWLADLKTGAPKQLYELPNVKGLAEVRSVSVSADGARIGASFFDRSVAFDAKTGQVVANVPRLRPLVLSPDGSKAIVGNGNGLDMFDLATGGMTPVAREIARTAGFAMIAWSADGKRLALVDAPYQQVIHVLSVSGDRIATLRGHRGPITSIRFDAAGERLISASEDGTARVWKLPAPTAK